MKAKLAFVPAYLSQQYRKEWNVSGNDYIHLEIDGKIDKKNIYRIGGLGTPNLAKDKYFQIIKYVEEYYPDSTTKIKKDKPHLAGHWCIINDEGIEKIVCDSYKTPYLVKNSCIYSSDNKYYNIETNKLYCNCYHAISCDAYLFLENPHDTDKTKRGVWQINKSTGEYIIHPLSN